MTTSTELDEIPRVGDGLAELAQQGLQDEGSGQGQPSLVDAPDPGPVVKFNGIKASIGDHDWKLGQHVEFTGEGVVIGVGKQLSGQDNTERRVITIKVSSTEVTEA